MVETIHADKDSVLVLDAVLDARGFQVLENTVFKILEVFGVGGNGVQFVR